MSGKKQLDELWAKERRVIRHEMQMDETSTRYWYQMFHLEFRDENVETDCLDDRRRGLSGSLDTRGDATERDEPTIVCFA